MPNLNSRLPFSLKFNYSSTHGKSLFSRQNGDPARSKGVFNLAILILTSLKRRQEKAEKEARAASSEAESQRRHPNLDQHELDFR